MYILGIETSCDETAAAIVKNGQTVFSNTIVSSLKEHAKFGGIIPEVASRRQLSYISAVVNKALHSANVTFADVGAIAVTQKPGLIGSLLVGISFAEALSYSLKKPLIPVDHIKAHIYANFLHKPDEHKITPELPAIGLVVSGGHTSLYKITSFKDFTLIGQTRDDAAGEAFDKVAKILSLGYPGGPVIEKTAKTVTNPTVRFNCAKLPGSYDFSFSGIKTGVLYHHQEHATQPGYDVAHVACGFQQSVVESLVNKTISACQDFSAKTVLIGGGVAANKAFRKAMTKKAEHHNITCFFPTMEYCTDNAAMIAGLGYHNR